MSKIRCFGLSSPSADSDADRARGFRRELKAPRGGRRRYTGLLKAVTAMGIELEVDKQKVEIPFDEIGKARLAG